MSIMQLEEPPRAVPRGFALWQLGFRPFYLLASSFAAISIALWALQYAGLLGASYLSGPMWHAHEMLFGFVLAVIVGFLLTAGRNWANQPTPTGMPLAALVALWLAARVLVLTPWGWAGAAANVGFALASAYALGRALWAGRSQRNYFFVGLLVLMGVASLAVHMQLLGVIELPGWVGIDLGLDVVLFIMAVMAGRVLPMFTNNGIPGAQAKRDSRVEKVALGSLLALLVADLLPLPAWLVAALCLVAAAAHLTRWWMWEPWVTLRTPLVWVLHAAYLWIPLHLALRVGAAFGWVNPSLATHALVAGAAGGLIIGMMTRTALGHTARPLKADRVDTVCYVLVLAAGVVRVFVPLVAPAWTIGAVLVSAALWSGGFALYAVRYAPRLWRPRLDGRPG